MTSRKRVQIRALGVIKDRPSESVPSENFTDVFNVEFRDGTPRRAEGYQDVWQDSNNFPFPPLHWLYAPFQQVGYWLAGCARNVFVTDGTTHTNITPAAGLSLVLLNRWTSCLLNSLAVMSNDSDIPIYWDGNPANPMVSLPDFPGQGCKVIRSYKNYLVACNIQQAAGRDDQVVAWSDKAAAGQVPPNWTASPTSDAGEARLADTVGPIQDALPLRDDFIIYKTRSVHVMSFVGGAAVMSFRTLFESVGALNSNCVAEHKGVHYVLGDGDLYAHDGQNVVSIAENQVKQWFFDNIEPSLVELCYVAVDKQKDMIYFCAPMNRYAPNEYPDVAVVYNVDNQSWSIREIPAASHAGSGVVLDDNSPFVETFDGLVFAQVPEGANALWLGGEVQGVLLDDAQSFEWKDNALNQPSETKLIEKIWPIGEAPDGTEFTVTVGARMTPGAPMVEVTRTYTVGTDESIDAFVNGRYLTVKMQTTAPLDWRIQGFDIQYQQVGTY